MSQEQWRRIDIVERIGRGELTVGEAAIALGLSRRQMQRIRKKVRKKGAAALTHGNTGRAPKHKTATLIREQIVSLWREKYAGFNDQHFTEKLVEVEKLEVTRDTVRRVLRAAGIGAARRKRRSKFRRRRDRRPQAGQMILWDGSRHDWHEGRGPPLCLMGAIDDATGELLPGAHFVPQECTLGYLRVLAAIVSEKGVPLVAYMDRHGTLRRNDQKWSLEEQLAGRRETTQVKRALDELKVEVIYALSPQAKGRVERLWGTLQDRLVSELRLVKASSASEADAVLARYRHEHNRRFAIPPEDSNSAWRSCPAGLTGGEACALQYARVVANNNSVRIGHDIVDIPKRSGRRATYAKATVIVRHLLAGGYRVYYRGEQIAAVRSAPPTEPEQGPRTVLGSNKRRRQVRETKARTEGVTESLHC